MRAARLLLGLVLATVATTAQAYTSHGQLPADETWSGTVTLTGDLTVPVGRTLTISPGTVVRLGPGDDMASEADTSRTELIVKGTLVITPGTATLKPAAAAAFSVEGRDAQDHPVAVSPTWAVVAGGGTINNQGIFVAGTVAGT
jgi:succinate dehydrogenase/fumarate reductase flavoprotein subunit